ncbi:MAG TPA: S8 family serine peptidase [Longimicrobium sp.]|nr:S8 family serine peptidase [Longimicrobium sp.]
MKRTLLIPLAALALAACQDASAPTGARAPVDGARAVEMAALSGAKLDAELVSLLSAALPTDRLLVIVNFDPAKTTTGTLAGQLKALGSGVVVFRHLSMTLALATPGQIAGIAGLHGVEGVWANRKVPLALRESIASMRADLAHGMGVTGKGVGIAIMDSGINGTNPDVAFPGKTVANLKFIMNLNSLLVDDGTPSVGGELYVQNLPNSDNTSGHGTHVAGIAAGSGASTFGGYKGVAHGAHLVGLSVGEGLNVLYASVLQATDWLLENRARYNVQVVNNSWGGSGTYDPSDPVVEASKAMHDAGITVVFAAGNEGPGENTISVQSVAPWVISVAAGCKLYVFDPTGSASSCADASGRASVLADFSSRGVAGDPLLHPDVTAPGVNIVSTRSAIGVVPVLGITSDLNGCNIGIQNLGNYTCMSGTSMSAPHVAGVVALMEEASGGKLTPAQAEQILVNTARPLPGYAWWEVGAGYVDAYAAVRAARALR